jgi:hypothetical protein
MALGNRSMDVTSFGAACDYENYYIEGQTPLPGPLWAQSPDCLGSLLDPIEQGGLVLITR